MTSWGFPETRYVGADAAKAADTGAGSQVALLPSEIGSLRP